MDGVAPAAVVAPYGWAIEYSKLPDGRPRVVFLLRDERTDLATANQHAVDLRGVLKPLFDR